MNKIFILKSLLHLASAVSTTKLVNSERKSCFTIFSDHGMNFSSFHQGVAHGVHALSLEEIRHFFKADAPEDNHIPTVNTDFRAESPVLYNAPLWGYSDRFQTWALKIMDFFMLSDQQYFYDTVSRQKISSHAQIGPQGAEKQPIRVYVVGWWVGGMLRLLCSELSRH